ncbi:MAG: MBL fold metallo-hydrolase [Parcubacteria group bacterium]|nr:MBL fold metallo-hydrolase [Parcubacteria group bacterium]
MQFWWFGQSFIKLATKETVFVIDPYAAKRGSMEASVAICINKDSDCGKIKGSPFIITQAGEYEVKDSFIWCFHLGKSKERDHIVYRLEAENLAIIHFGRLPFAPSEQELDQIEGADVVILPIGGGGVCDSKAAISIIHYLEPKAVIPLYYGNMEAKEGQDAIALFIKQMGVKDFERADKVNIKASDLSEEETKVMVLNPASSE